MTIGHISPHFKCYSAKSEGQPNHVRGLINFVNNQRRICSFGRSEIIQGLAKPLYALRCCISRQYNMIYSCSTVRVGVCDEGVGVYIGFPIQTSVNGLRWFILICKTYSRATCWPHSFPESQRCIRQLVVSNSPARSCAVRSYFGPPCRRQFMFRPG